MWVWKSVTIFLFFLHCDRFISTHALYRQPQLYEGSQCTLANGSGEGICLKAIHCPDRVDEILSGNYSDVGRCGFDKFDEIYCCPKPPFPRSEDEDKRAEIACQNYKKTLGDLDDDGYFGTSVIGGIAAKVREFPHMVALRYKIFNDDEDKAGGSEYACGGTLISRKHVLTAAHCVNNIQGLVPVEVVLGAIDLSETRSPGRQKIEISKIVQHPEFKRSLNYHDLAILELKHEVKFTRDVHPTCLMSEPLSRKTVNARTSFTILGWGAIDEDRTPSMKLLKAEGLKFVTKQRCAKLYKNSRANIPNGLDQAMICVKDPDTKRKADTCGGDSGGPLLIASPLFPRVMGVTSFGQACGGSTPGVYTAVYRYLNWIEDQVWPNSN